jgi:hypothetical protein
MWFNPSQITKFAKPPIATLATIETFHPRDNAKFLKVAEVAEVAITHDSKIIPLHDLAIEWEAEPVVGDTAITSNWWVIYYPDQKQQEAAFCPDATFAEVMAWCPGAIVAKPIADRTRLKATPEQEAELQRLVPAVVRAYGGPLEERVEALALALADPVTALQSYRLMATDCGLHYETLVKLAESMGFDDCLPRTEVELLTAVPAG